MPLRATILKKFFLVLIPVFVTVIGLGLCVVSDFHLRTVRDQFNMRIGTQAASIAGLIGNVDVASEPDLTSRLLRLALADPAIACAELHESGEANLRLAAPVQVGCGPFADLQKLVLHIPDSSDAELVLRFSEAELETARRQTRDFALAVTLGAMLAAALACALGYRYAVGRPLKGLLTAIRHTAETGRFVTAPVRAEDEIGVVIRSFNDLQRTLERESARALESRATLARREEELAVQNAHFSAAIENMAQGLSMFDADKRLIICNSMFARLYRLDPQAMKPGITLRDILEMRRASGCVPAMYSGAPEYTEAVLQATSVDVAASGENELADGHIVAFVRQPMPGGGWVSLHMDVTEKRQAEREIAYLAHHDAVTGLANRVRLREHLEDALRRGSGTQGFAVLCLDLDRFKHVNDTLGHSAGDALLRSVSERLQSLVGPSDLVARTGGDEFAIVQMGGRGARAAAAALAGRVVTALGVPFDLGDHQTVIGTSIGIALAPADGAEADRLLMNADMALYRAKSEGRGTACFFEGSMEAKARSRRLLESDLRAAVAAGDFEVWYQPVVHLAEGRVSGLEALLRWRHPTRGLVSPQEVVPLAEETGLIAQIGESVIRQACAEAVTWPGDLRVSVNVSPVQLRGKSLVYAVMSALAATRLPPHRLELEITEAVFLNNSETTLAVLQQLRGLGVRIAMDDFGTGYSSLSYLRRFPFDKIKIDQSFVRDLIDKPDAVGVIRAVSELARSFGMTTTAEGVETRAQLEQLRHEGCTEVQGYYYSRPVPARDVKGLLAAFAQRAAAA